MIDKVKKLVKGHDLYVWATISEGKTPVSLSTDSRQEEGQRRIYIKALTLSSLEYEEISVRPQ